MMIRILADDAPGPEPVRDTPPAGPAESLTGVLAEDDDEALLEVVVLIARSS
ncbi:MAG: hypothetical protein ACOC0P_00170 [Planctomycetota bacterium]